VTQFDDAECPFRELGIIFHQAPGSTSPGACSVTRDLHVRTECEKESNSGTSVASGSARSDPYTVHLVATAPKMIFYIELSDTPTSYSNISDPARRTKNNVNAPSMIRATPFIYLLLPGRESIFSKDENY
jgi:hypothetical protein